MQDIERRYWIEFDMLLIRVGEFKISHGKKSGTYCRWKI
jgi:hypothetical protein